MKSILKKILPDKLKDILRFMIDFNKLFYGLVLFAVFQKRLNESYLSFIRIFCVTSGFSNNFLTAIVRLLQKPYKINHPSGVLGELSTIEIDHITNELNKKGYYVSKKLLPKEICEKLIKFALSRTSLQHKIEDQEDSEEQYTLYDRGSPKATKYSFDQQDLVNFPEIQDLIADDSFLAITQSYMKSKVYFDQCMLWWSTAYQSKPDVSAAQMYHFDMERIKWLKIFVYLTDVTIETGPHTFISGSHIANGIPKELLKKGYSRLTDQEILNHYNPEKIIKFTGPVGTVIIEDTRGLHKGEPLIKGDRLILELQYSNYMFGATTPESTFTSLTEKLKKSIENYPAIYSFFTKNIK